ncbi:polysaccharide deacetylase family protein [Rhodovibrio sodomensis]|uniref:polysaccharide deacetylase family protein n=1 Tax=Rhodovibrio sodomensis TaxID=1088 RepID=UPI001F5BC113|nr:polysaccharide deacetylase family protein [Rhodovibrio sodomensis]
MVALIRLVRSAVAGLAAVLLAFPLATAAVHAQSDAGGTPAKPAVDNGASVVMYHRFGNSRYPSTNITLAQFEQHIAELSKPKYNVLPLADIVSALRQQRPLPPYTVAITIDDAYRSVWQEAVPRLREAGLPFTVFVSTGPVGGSDYMTWDQLRQLARMELATIGNHTVSHAHLTKLSPDQVRDELASAQARFQAELGRKPDLFAYPYGEYSTAVQQAVRAAGFIAAFGQQSGAIARTSERYGLPRFALNEAYGDMDRFRTVVNALPLPVHDVVPDDNVLTPEENPPMYGFTVHQSVDGIEGLDCYASGRGELDVQRLGGQRVELRFDSPFPEGRVRINCTLMGPDGRWRWFGNQFLVTG